MFPLVDAIYWLSLATWFGCVLGIAIVPPIVMRVIRHADPTLPRVLSVNLDKQHSVLLAGEVISAIVATFFRLQLLCAGVYLIPLVAKWFSVDRSGVNVIVPILISALYVLSVSFLIYGNWVVLPKVMRHRQTYLDNADNPDIANPELDLFDRYSHELFTIIRNMLFAVSGMIVLSTALRPIVLTLSSTN